MSFLGLGGGDPSGYSSLTPDQSALLGQQGWYPRPDMVLPTGQSMQQPPGYSNLTPAQAATVNQLGYYSNTDAAGKPSMFSDILSKLNGPAGQDALKKLQSAMGGTPQPLQGQQAPAQPPPHYPGAMDPYHSVYYTRVSLNPDDALKRLQRGY